MYISDTKTLAKAIDQLNNQRVAKENILLDKIYAIRQFGDPIYQINKLLPRRVLVAEVIGKLMDESIVNVANKINNKLSIKSTDSFIKQTGNNLLKLTVSNTLNHHTYKIKIISLSILKIIFKKLSLLLRN